jgi:hypothetical protein
VSDHDLRVQVTDRHVTVSLSCKRGGGSWTLTIDGYQPEAYERMTCSCAKYGVRFDGALVHAGPIRDGGP